MTEEVVKETGRNRRLSATRPKCITLTEPWRERIQAYADEHELYFSVAIETLALMSLGHTTADSLPRLVTNLLERALNRQFNRFAKLLSWTVITVGEINYKADVLLLQTIWREARLDEENFISNLQVSTDPHEQPAALARQVRDGIRRDARKEALARLQQKLSELDSLDSLDSLEAQEVAGES